jgi:hypothetical protein
LIVSERLIAFYDDTDLCLPGGAELNRVAFPARYPSQCIKALRRSRLDLVFQQANPQVIYVPAYNPVVVYGPPIYPYPPIYYPPPGYYAAGVAIGFGVGVAMGAFWGGGWGYGPRWGYGSVNINVNNRYVNHYNRYNSYNRYGGNWNHNPRHRGGAPYANRGTANRYGGTARGDSMATRQATARQNTGASARTQSATGANRRGNAGANRAGASPRTSSVGANRGTASAGGGDRVGNREQPGLLQPKRQRLRRREQSPEQQRRPQQQPARVVQRKPVARRRRRWRRRRATEVTGHDESTDDLDLGTIDGDAAPRHGGSRPRLVWRARDVFADRLIDDETGREAGHRSHAATRGQGIPDCAGGRERAHSGGGELRRTGARRNVRSRR